MRSNCIYDGEKCSKENQRIKAGKRGLRVRVPFYTQGVQEKLLRLSGFSAET